MCTCGSLHRFFFSTGAQWVSTHAQKRITIAPTTITTHFFYIWLPFIFLNECAHSCEQLRCCFDLMFRDVCRSVGRQRRAERRLETIVRSTGGAASRSWTHRVSKEALAKQRNISKAKEERWRERHPPLTSNPTPRAQLSAADIELLQRQQHADLAEEAVRARTTSWSSGNDGRSFPSSRTQQENYDSVDSHSGQSLIQQRFDALAREAVFKYGPPLPVEFVEENDIVTMSSTATSASSQYCERDAAHFYDEVQIRPQELYKMICKVEPTFSVRTHADSVPFSLLLKNCLYFNVRNGKVHFMRSLRRVQRREKADESGGERCARSAEVIVVLLKYKMREAPSFDGVRQGPQPWLYNYRMV
uniref:Uncharacterized protein n=1 Tax=Trypanosoma congolense (strain IL3000) TaxID=1068625 RepID=G0UK41_TRYCI|nr:conserved hypothetical protein [Trypanosoma congolense IL3000]